MNNNIRFAANKFSSMADMPFDPKTYSELKFGCDTAAGVFGTELAVKFFEAHAEILLTNDCVVIPSPYNFVPNAATIMSQHFVNHLNKLLVEANGQHVEWSIIHRKVSYVNDYGFLDASKRKKLIDGDSFYLNQGFLKGKTLLFIDDVRITGTHENKLVEVMKKNRLKNNCVFLYYAEFMFDGTGADIEAQINFAGLSSVEDFVDIARRPGHHMIVRPLKYLLSQSESDLTYVMQTLGRARTRDIYHACLGEGYYRIPAYQANFKLLADRI
jgi:hypothetical protein